MIAAALLASLLGSAVAAPPAPPVLVELFTSEGCSSCPPADALLGRLLAEGRVIALGEHVDYWDDLGWRDPYSSPRFTRRQAEYARRLGAGVYTPQLVVAGRAHVLGSDEAAVRAAIAAAARGARGEVALRVADRAVEIEARWPGGVRAEVLVALVRDRATSRVTRGENGGNTLSHVAIVRSLEVAGTGAGAFAGRVTLAGVPDADRVIVLVQEPGAGAVLAAGEAVLGATARAPPRGRGPSRAGTTSSATRRTSPRRPRRRSSPASSCRRPR